MYETTHLKLYEILKKEQPGVKPGASGYQHLNNNNHDLSEIIQGVGTSYHRLWI